MRGRFAHRTVLAILIICQLYICLAAESLIPNDNGKYIDTIHTFDDNMLKNTF